MLLVLKINIIISVLYPNFHVPRFKGFTTAKRTRRQINEFIHISSFWWSLEIRLAFSLCFSHIVDCEQTVLSKSNNDKFNIQQMCISHAPPCFQHQHFDSNEMALQRIEMLSGFSIELISFDFNSDQIPAKAFGRSIYLLIRDYILDLDAEISWNQRWSTSKCRSPSECSWFCSESDSRCVAIR